MMELDFNPKINSRSHDLMRNSRISLVDRMDIITKQKQLRIEALEEEGRQKELTNVTAQPDLKTPCVCGGGIGLTQSGLSVNELR